MLKVKNWWIETTTGNDLRDVLLFSHHESVDHDPLLLYTSVDCVGYVSVEYPPVVLVVAETEHASASTTVSNATLISIFETKKQKEKSDHK